MNRSQAKHALRMDHIENIDGEHMYKVDDDMWVYDDFGESLQYTLTEVDESIVISSMTFHDVKLRMDAEDAALYTEMEQYTLAETVGLCPECLQLEELCTCPDE